MASVADATQRLRVKYEAVANVNSGWLNVYCTSIESRVRELQHAEATVLESAKALAGGLASTSANPTLDAQGRLEFYSSAFWAMAYSLYDITANAVNTVHVFQTDERRVSFKSLAEIAQCVIARNDLRLPQELAKKIQSANKSLTCRRLINYRNCSMHRRSVCMSTRRITTQVSDAYSRIASTGEGVTQVQVFVCDDPLAAKPTFAKNRELTAEVALISNKVLEQIRQIVSKI